MATNNSKPMKISPNMKKNKSLQSGNQLPIFLGCVIMAMAIVMTSFINFDLPFDGVIRNESGAVINQPTQMTDNYRFQIARGAIPGAAPVFMTANNGAVGSTAETIWNVGGLYPWPTTGVQLSFVSDDADDTLGGTGANIVLVEGLDINYDIILEAVTMNGTTPVNTTQDFYRINNVIVINAGTTETNEGTIDITHNGNIVSRITAGEGQDQQAVYSVPANHTLFTGTFSVSSGKDDEVEVDAWIKTNITGVWFLSSRTYAYQNTWTFENYNEFPFPEKTDIDIRTQKTQVGASAKVTSVLELFVVPNSYLEELNSKVIY
jgi:hypothetical protein